MHIGGIGFDEHVHALRYPCAHLGDASPVFMRVKDHVRSQFRRVAKLDSETISQYVLWQERECIMTIWTPRLRATAGPKYRAIVDAIARAIETKELKPGERLPAHRELADRLKVSIQTVSRGYTEAERLGLVSGQVGRGTFVQYIRPDASVDYIADMRPDGAIDCSGLVPFISEHHVRVFREALSELAQGAALARVLAYSPSAGTDHHRTAGAEWLNRNGVAVRSDDVIITTGVAHGLWVAMASLLEPGDTIATEALVGSTMMTSASVLKLQLRGLPIDEEGIIPEAFANACRQERIKALCVTPCYSNPTVALMGEARRREIAEIARKHDVAILEDDVFGPLIPRRPKPLWHYAPERTYYTTSFSKAVLAAVRVGYLVGPKGTMHRLVSRLRATGWMSDTWTAEVAARWIHDGTVEKLIQWQREKLRARHAVFDEIMGDHQYASHPYAMHVWVTLPGLWRPLNFVQQARARGVLIVPPDPFIVGRAAEPHAFRISIGDTVHDEADFIHALQRIDALMREDAEPVHYSSYGN